MIQDNKGIKPIVVMYIPSNLTKRTGEQVRTWELAASFNGEDNTIYNVNKELYKDYLWFCFPTDDNEFTMEVFHPKDLTEVQYSELKELITNEISKIKTTNND